MKSAPKKPRGQRVLVLLISTFALLLVGANLVMTAKLSDSGQQLKALEEKASMLRQDNQVLEQQLLEQYSLTRLVGEADEMGFSKKPAKLVVVKDAPIAQLIESR